MMDGFLNILKPPGMSSHDVIGAVRKVLRMKRVGHAGTLDPAAAGVLPVAVGQAARLIEYLELADKTYRAELTFGFATDSGDDTGKITEEVTDFMMPSQEAIEHVLAGFTGCIRQTPPAHSAIKIGGKRACDLLREGKEVEVPSREVTIHSLDLVAYQPEAHKVLLDVKCSKGTYIRSLCLDIGAAFLVRSRVGDFALADALTLEELAGAGEGAVLEPAHFLSHLERYDLDPRREKAFCNGLGTGERQRVPETDTLRVYCGGRFLGIGRYDRASQEVIPAKVIHREPAAKP